MAVPTDAAILEFPSSHLDVVYDKHEKPWYLFGRSRIRRVSRRLTVRTLAFRDLRDKDAILRGVERQLQEKVQHGLDITGYAQIILEEDCRDLPTSACQWVVNTFYELNYPKVTTGTKTP